MQLANKHALVCGASAGIGAASALKLAQSGADVTLLARSRERLDRIRAELPTQSGQSHRSLVCDHADTDQLGTAVAALADTHPVHILVNNSGGPPPGPALSARPQDFIDAFTRHLLANQVLVQAVLPSMRAQKYGRIINIISTSVREPIPGLGVSNTIRGAVASWAKTLSRELGPDGITVNNVLPGYTDTERLQQLFANAAQNKGHALDEEIRIRLSEVPLGRFAQPAEIAAAVVFLASADAAYISGINLAVDGARSRGA